MRKEFMAAILVSGLALASVGSVVVRHYMAPTIYELNTQVGELVTSVNQQWLEQAEQSVHIRSHPDLFDSTMRLKASYDDIYQAYESLAEYTYGDMATHDPVRFQFRRAECHLRNEDTIRCRAVSKVART